MRLPWVPREMYEVERERVMQLEQRLSDLMDGYATVHSRLLDAMAQATKPAQRPVMPERTRDDVIEAIIARSGGNNMIRQHLALWARDQRRMQISDEQIIARIQNWDSDDEENTSGNES